MKAHRYSWILRIPIPFKDAMRASHLPVHQVFYRFGFHNKIQFGQKKIRIEERTADKSLECHVGESSCLKNLSFKESRNFQNV